MYKLILILSNSAYTQYKLKLIPLSLIYILMGLPVSLIAGNRFPIENLREFGFYSCVRDLC